MSTQTVIPSAAAPFPPIEKVANPSNACIIPVVDGPDAFCDEQDFPFLSLFTWRVNRTRTASYPITHLAGKAFPMHQLVVLESQKKKINHRDYNTFNNCRANLRIATNSQVQATRPKIFRRVCSSIYKGVSFNKRDRNWHAYITCAGVSRTLGYFITEESAARAYDQAAYETFGEYAYLNFGRPSKEVPIPPPATLPSRPPARRLVNATGEQIIPLTNGSHAVCDPEDFTLLSCLTWRAERFGDLEYAVSRINGRSVFMHLLVLRCGTKLRVIHQDGNGLNNQRANLLFPHCGLVSKGKTNRPTSSRFKGVLRIRNKKWLAKIIVKGAFIRLGNFENEEDAARAYDAAARAAFGPFAYQNFPEQPAC